MHTGPLKQNTPWFTNPSERTYRKVHRNTNHYIYCRITRSFHSTADHKTRRLKHTVTTCCWSFVYFASLSKVVSNMCRVKFVIVMLCLVNLVHSRPKKYYYNPDDPNAIAFSGPTNYETRKPSENEVLDDDAVGNLINPRFGLVGANDEVSARRTPAPPPAPVDTGFYFPED